MAAARPPAISGASTQVDPHSLFVPAIGSQFQSARTSAPIHTISQVSRAHRDKMYIGKDFQKTLGLGRESPIEGAKYNLPDTLSKKGVSFAAGGKVRSPLDVAEEDGISTNDALAIEIAAQKFKFDRDRTMIIGTEPRGRLKEVTLIRAHAAAFFGRESPGPAAVGEKYGPDFSVVKKKLGKAVPFASKTEAQGLYQTGDTPESVGPGVYAVKDTAFAKQYLTKRTNQPVHAFPHQEKFGKTRCADSVSLLDAARSSLGSQTLGRNRSETSVGFGRGTRSQCDRQQLCYTKLDQGPKANMAKMHLSMPALPMERHVMQAGRG